MAKPERPAAGAAVLLYLPGVQLVGLVELLLGIQPGDEAKILEGWPRSPATWTLRDPMSMQLLPVGQSGGLGYVPVALLVPELQIVGSHVIAWEILEGPPLKFYEDTRRDVRLRRAGLELPGRPS